MPQTERQLKQQAKYIRKMIICLDDLIRSSELPIKLNIDIIEGHHNLNTVWKQIGVIPYAYTKEFDDKKEIIIKRKL